jgi:hypothetical protein
MSPAEFAQLMEALHQMNNNLFGIGLILALAAVFGGFK